MSYIFDHTEPREAIDSLDLQNEDFSEAQTENFTDLGESSSKDDMVI